MRSAEGFISAPGIIALCRDWRLAPRQGNLHFPCDSLRCLPFCVPHESEHLALQAIHFHGVLLTVSGGDTIAIYHCSIKIVSRGKGKSAVAAAAYRAGEKLTNEWDGLTHDYTRKGGVVHSEIMLPPHAPPSFSDRSILWNSVEQIEKSNNSQLAREIEIALPVELSREEQTRLVREYCSSQFVSKGMCADFNIHDTGNGNPHAHILLTMHYNPMAYIKTESDVLKFVNALIANTKGDGKEGDEFWTKAETLLYCALVAYIVFEGPEEERNMNTLVEMINSMEVREDDESFKNAVDYMFDGLAKRNPQHFAVRQYAKYKLASGKTAKSILISCGARLAPFDIAELREIMSYDELELDKLGDEKTALFFLISDTDSTYNFIVALAFSQMFNLLCERADNKYGGRLPHHVRVLWDEAANTGQVPGLEKIVAVIRSREVSLTLFYQAMSQCKALYKDNAETIMGNMDSIVFLGGREASTLKDISENWLGKATISMQTDSRTRGQSESYGLNTQRLGRELLTTSEITTMPGNKCLLQLRGLPPFFSPKYDLKQHPNYRYTAEHDSKRNAFHLERLTSRRLRLKPEEEYTVYEVDASDEDADILNYDDLDSADDFV